MNGKMRVKPLEERYTLHVGETTYTIVSEEAGPIIPGEISEVAKGITWTPEEWPRQKLHEYILKLFPDKDTEENIGEDGCFTFLVAGENPAQARSRAERFFVPCLPHRLLILDFLLKDAIAMPAAAMDAS
ncbi:hypothetical protein SEMRO_124_G059860.1 [Seminavis robusta]|uniref:Uncharacterized protein n=1 Tax=Seminavis robusta TaxID=568900 RepID=A0A9N8DEW5_9STRA|nr:hypothetical protein SEMRO_124_G059860.1 [Seminavis robusta]|eukprot:Sro124_g059860.1 n/a (130) ;mRNA; r:45166-45555